MGEMVLKAAMAYIANHPEVIERLLELLVKDLIDSLEKKHAATA